MAGTRAALALLAVLAVVSLSCVAADDDGKVLTLDFTNFESEVKSHDFIAVMFYAPWYARSLSPDARSRSRSLSTRWHIFPALHFYVKAAEMLAEEGSEIVLARINGDEKKHKGLARKYGVGGFPTIKIFRTDYASPLTYKGPREAAGLVAYLKKQAGPASTKVRSGSDLKRAMEDDSVVVVGLFATLSSPEFESFLSVARELRTDFVFKHTTDASLLPAKGPQLEAPAVRLLKQFDEGYSDTEEFSPAALRAFIERQAVPRVVEFSQDPKDRPYLARVFQAPTNKSLLFLTYSLPDAPEFRSRYVEAAQEQPDSIRLVIGEAAANEHALKYFGLAVSDTPAMVIHDPRYDAKFIRTHIAPSDIAPFLADFQAGRAERVLKSEAVPQGDAGAVKKVVANSFKEIVLNSRKNVLVEFHAPWCTACADLDPVLKDVAESLSGQRDVVVAKMDFSANDIPSDKFDVKALPTIYLYTSAGVAVPYAGDNSKASLLAFVRKHKGAKKAASAPPTAEELAEAEEIANAEDEEEDDDERKDELYRDGGAASSEEGIVMELPCLPFNPAEVFLPGSSKTLHLYEARYLALLEEVLTRSSGLLGHVVLEPMRTEDGQGMTFVASYGCLSYVESVRKLQVGALVAVRGVGRIRLQQLTQVEPFLRGQVAVVSDDRPQEGAGAGGTGEEVKGAVEELRAVLRDVQELQIKIKTTSDVPLQTPLERALRWVDTVTAASAAAAPPAAPTAPGAPATAATAATQQPAATPPQTVGDALRTGADTSAGADAGDATSSSSGSGSTEASPSAWSILPDDNGVEPDQLPPEQLESAARFLGFQGLPTPAIQSTVAVDPASVPLDPDFGASAAELHGLLQKRLAAMEETDTMKRAALARQYAEQSRAALAAKVALQSLQL
ncbi:unnamed protein product [Closterium sp. NIES-65]|nr:unnamed protein product [Closterium sp. NIES-65]